MNFLQRTICDECIESAGMDVESYESVCGSMDYWWDRGKVCCPPDMSMIHEDDALKSCPWYGAHTGAVALRGEEEV